MSQLESVGNMLKKKAADPGNLPESDKSAAPPLETCEDPERLQQILNGMGSGTARLVIDKEAIRKICKDIDLKGLPNRGRYYMAKVARPNGSVIDELLVDKQNANVQFPGRRP